MIESSSDNIESSEIKSNTLNSSKNKFALFGRITFKITVALGGLMIGCVLGFVLAFAVGLIDVIC